MAELVNIYCDESCHLETKDITEDNRYMVLGGISCPDHFKTEAFQRIKDIKKSHNISQFAEMKWTRVANGKYEAYEDIVNYFFDVTDFSFRAVAVDKSQLNHEKHAQTHDDFYYKMYWQMLEWFVEPSNRYNIYLDLKDTLGVYKVKQLHKVLCHSQHDFDRKVIEKIQEVRSHEIAILQITDILIGAISYASRYKEHGASEAKIKLINLIRKRSGYTLERSTSLGARKFNIFHWEGQK